ncbi:MAG: SHOCT domain-containing protein [Deltaproteobacteria bacterium]|jgi:hypothetical protein|nr:SHOCT domain-containing protein [Deltaproteobacteria bacterium]
MMKKFLLLFFVSISLIFASTTLYAGDKHEIKQKLYTSHNIWLWPSHNIKCINYKGAPTKIDAGTEVTNVQIQSDIYSPDEAKREEKISFKLADSGKKYTIWFFQNYHPRKTINDYMKNMFTAKTFDELTEGMSVSEKTAIKQGIIVDGMSKEAVLVSYGPPPEHVTPSLDNEQWKYWIDKRKTQLVRFNVKNKTYNTGNPSTGDQKADTKPYTLEDKLVQLKRLLDKGLITSQEYRDKKADLLKEY